MGDMNEWNIISKKKTNTNKNLNIRRTTYHPKIIKTIVENKCEKKTPQIHYLNDTWIIWFHDVNDMNWNIDSYVKLLEFNTVEDFWIFHNNIDDTYNGMYYLMRKNFPPIWEHEVNINGGGWTFRIDKKYAQDFFLKLSLFCIGENICSTPKNIVGVSISPKMSSATIRLWTNTINTHIKDFDEIKSETYNDSLRVDFNNARFTANSGVS
jgi:hypothetical protein